MLVQRSSLQTSVRAASAAGTVYSMFQKTAQSLMHHNFATVSHSVVVFTKTFRS